MKLVLGFAIGVALGLVFAPASGEKTRAQLKNKARDLAHYPERRAQEKIRRAAAETEQRAGEIGSRVGRDAAQAAVKAVISEAPNKNDQGQTA